MVAAPWFLLAGGIALIIIGYFLAGLGRGADRVFINPRMSDKEIERAMNKPQGSPLGNMVMLVGFLAVLVSIGRRLVRVFDRSP